MRFGCCVNMIATGKDGTGIEFVEKLSEIGYDYVELPLAEMAALPDDKFTRIVERVEKSGLRCETCNNFFPKTIRLTGLGVNETEIMDYVEKALARAHKLGVQYVAFGSGGAKNVSEGFPMEKGYRQVVDLLKKVDPIARKNNITIVIEPLRRAECNLINSFEEGCKLAKDVDCENIQVLVDFYHLSQEHEPVQNIIDNGHKYLRHVHFACDNGRVYPADIDEDNYRPFIDALKSVGYNGRVSVEAYTEDFELRAPLALKFMKAYF